MRLVIARCSVDYKGRLTAHLPMAPRLLLVKADGSISIHADGGAYKPLNWISHFVSAGSWHFQRGKTDSRCPASVHRSAGKVEAWFVIDSRLGPGGAQVGGGPTPPGGAASALCRRLWAVASS